MKRTIFCAIGLLIALTSLHAQTILGTWQGTLPTPDRQIVDETGLNGSFDLTLTMPTGAMQGGPAGPEDNRPDAIRSAIQPLGFHLVPKKEAIPVLIIDHLEPPTPN